MLDVPIVSLGFGMTVRTPYRPPVHHGVDHPNAKLTAEALRDIRLSQYPHAMLAQRYGVDESRVSRIKSGKAYK